MKKPIKIILIVLGAILLVLAGKICFNYIYNSTENFFYHLGSKDINPDPLLVANFHEPYVAWYNEGCVDFKQERYENAQEEFEKALTYKLPEKKECDIRVNLVLSILSQYDWTGKTTVDGNKLLTDLYKCRDILLEDGCATDTNDGHDVEAQRLKNEIDDLIEMLEQQKEQGGEDDDSQSSENQDDPNGGQSQDQDQNQGEDENDDHEETPEEKTQREKEETIKKALEDQREDSQQEREEEMRRQEEMNSDYQFNFYGTIW